MISCQVCWRTTRWHNGPIRRSLNPYPSKVFQDWSNKWGESVAHSIVARRLFTPIKAVYMSADQPRPSHFSLAIRRRTIHGRMADNSGAIGNPFGVLEQFEVKRQIGRAACHLAPPG